MNPVSARNASAITFRADSWTERNVFTKPILESLILGYFTVSMWAKLNLFNEFILKFGGAGDVFFRYILTENSDLRNQFIDIIVAVTKAPPIVSDNLKNNRVMNEARHFSTEVFPLFTGASRSTDVDSYCDLMIVALKLESYDNIVSHVEKFITTMRESRGRKQPVVNAITNEVKNALRRKCAVLQ